MKVALSLILCIILHTFSNAQVVTRLAGGYLIDGGPAKTALTIPSSVTYNNGKMYFSSGDGVVYRIENGKLFLELGSRLFDIPLGKPDFTVDSDKFALPESIFSSLVPAKNGEIYFIDYSRNFLFHKNKNGKIFPVAGDFDSSGNYDVAEGKPATSTYIAYFTNFAVDENNHVFVSNNGQIFKIDSTGIFRTFAGFHSVDIDSFTYHDVPATSVPLKKITGMNIDSKGNLVAISKSTFYRITPSGLLSSFRYSPVSLNNSSIQDMAIDTNGNVYVHDSNYIYKFDRDGIQTSYLSLDFNSRLRSMKSLCWVANDSFACVIDDSVSDAIYTFGRSKELSYTAGYNFDNMLPVGWNIKSLLLGLPITNSFCFNENGNIVAPWNIKDEFSRTPEMVTNLFHTDGTFTTISSLQYDEIKSNGDGNYFLLNRKKHQFYATDFTTTTMLDSASGMISIQSSDWCLTPKNEILYISQFKIHKINRNGKDSVIAGNGSRFFSGDDSAAATAGIVSRNIATDKFGNIYVADFGLSTLNYRIRKIDSNGIITTIAGKGSDSLENSVALTANLGKVSDIKIDTAGNIYFRSGGKLKVILANGRLKTICNTDSLIFQSFIDTISAWRLAFSTVKDWNIDDSGRIIAISNYSIFSVMFRFPSLYRYAAPDTNKSDTSFSLQLYPNPTNGTLHVKYYTAKSGNVQMSIIDAAGRRMPMFETTAAAGLNDETIELPRGMQAGIYFFKIVTPSGGGTTKFALQR